MKTGARFAAITGVLVSAACASTPTVVPVEHGAALSGERIREVSSDPRLTEANRWQWEPDERILAYCEPESNRKLVITTHRVIDLRPNFVNAVSSRIRGIEVIERQDGWSGAQPRRFSLAWQSAHSRGGTAVIAGRCDMDQLEVVLAAVIRMRADAGDGEELLARHQQQRERAERQAEASRQAEERRLSSDELHSPSVAGLSWSDVPPPLLRRREQFEAFHVEPRDILWADRQYAGQAGDCREVMGHTRECSLPAGSVTYAGACRAVGAGRLQDYYLQKGAGGTLIVNCRNHTIRINVGVFERGVIEFRQYDASNNLIYHQRASLGLIQ